LLVATCLPNQVAVQLGQFEQHLWSFQIVMVQTQTQTVH
jgi:hypothetical protein